jgi:transposase
MSLHPRTRYHVPAATARVAMACFPPGPPSLPLRNALGPLLQKHAVAVLFPVRGQPAAAPGRLALATGLPCAEHLADRQAANAVRRRIDWKYLLGLAWTEAGCEHTVRSECRTRFVQHSAVTRLFDALLQQWQGVGLLKARGRQRTDSTHVLAAISALHRLALVGEARRAALHCLAGAAPAWWRAQLPSDWVQRYGPRLED